MAKESTNLSPEMEEKALSFGRWLRNTKKFTCRNYELLQLMLDDKLSHEFSLLYTYLTNHTDASADYISSGKYDFSEAKFSTLLHFAAASQVSSNPKISYQVYSSVLEDCSKAGQSFDGSILFNSYKNRPINYALVKNNIPFISALKDQGYDFNNLDDNEFSLCSILISQIQKGTSTLEHLKMWINAGLPINTLGVQKNQYYTALDIAEEYGLNDAVSLLKNHGAVRLLAKLPSNIKISDGLMKAWQEYFAIFDPGGYDYYLDLLKVLFPKPEDKIDNQAFAKYFDTTAKLINFVDYVKADASANSSTDSSIVDQFEPLIAKARDVFADNPKIIIPKINEQEAALLAWEGTPEEQGYLWNFIRNYPSQIEFIQEEIKKIKNGELHKVNLRHDIYKLLISFCVLKLNAKDEKDVELFKGLLNKIGDVGLQYGYGKVTYNNKDFNNNLCMDSNLTALKIAAQAHRKNPDNADSTNKFACILAEHGYGTKLWDSDSTVAHLAIEAGNIKLLQMLANMPGVDFNLKDINDSPPLAGPLLQANEEMIKILIEGGANINYVDPEDGNTIPHLLVQAGLLDSIKIAKNYGADLNIIDGTGNTLAHQAIICDKKEIYQYLVSEGFEGADLNEKLGYTTLHLLAKAGWIDEIQKAIEKGADIQAVGKCGHSILEYATMPLLESNSNATTNQVINVAKFLIEKGYQLTQQDEIRLNEIDGLFEKVTGYKKGHFTKPASKSAVKKIEKEKELEPAEKDGEEALNTQLDSLSLSPSGNTDTIEPAGSSSSFSTPDFTDPALNTEPIPNLWG